MLNINVRTPYSYTSAGSIRSLYILVVKSRPIICRRVEMFCPRRGNFQPTKYKISPTFWAHATEVEIVKYWKICYVLCTGILYVYYIYKFFFFFVAVWNECVLFAVKGTIHFNNTSKWVYFFFKYLQTIKYYSFGIISRYLHSVFDVYAVQCT